MATPIAQLPKISRLALGSRDGRPDLSSSVIDESNERDRGAASTRDGTRPGRVAAAEPFARATSASYAEVARARASDVRSSVEVRNSATNESRLGV